MEPAASNLLIVIYIHLLLLDTNDCDLLVEDLVCDADSELTC